MKVYRVWWGSRPVMAKADVSGVAGVNSYNAFHPRKLFLSQLPKIHSEADVDLRRAELERAFRKYGGDRGVQVVVPMNATYAFVEMESERQADLALAEMSSKYRINRAKRSRREVLKEERAAKEAASSGLAGPKGTSDWD
jgi:RNA recognition motif-containing protein